MRRQLKGRSLCCSKCILDVIQEPCLLSDYSERCDLHALLDLLESPAPDGVKLVVLAHDVALKEQCHRRLGDSSTSSIAYPAWVVRYHL